MTSRTRDPWLDNTKMVLVTLVVVGHSWGLLASDSYDNWLYDFLYFWHIPAFVFLSGYLSKSFEWDRRRLKGLVYTLLVPYLLFEPALYYFRRLLGQDEGGILWLHPHWAMWYLIVLFWWRLGTPVLKRHWLWIPASVAISLAGGLMSGDPSRVFYVSRILGLLPFFVLGLHLAPRHLKRLDDPWVRVAAVGALVGILAVARFTDDFARTAFLYYDAGYDDLGVQPEFAVQTRLTVMALGLLGAFSVLALIPRRGGWFARMGAATMVVYLMHGFFVKFAGFAGLGTWSQAQPLVALVATTVGAVGLALALASPPARRRLVWLVDPLTTWEKHRVRRVTSDASRRSTGDAPRRLSSDASRRLSSERSERVETSEPYDPDNPRADIPPTQSAEGPQVGDTADRG